MNNESVLTHGQAGLSAVLWIAGILAALFVTAVVYDSRRTARARRSSYDPPRKFTLRSNGVVNYFRDLKRELRRRTEYRKLRNRMRGPK